MTGTSSVCQFYDSPRQLICFWRTFFVCAKLIYSSRPKLPGSFSHTQAVLQTDTLFYIHCGSGLRDRRRTYHTILKLAWSVCIWYVSSGFNSHFVAASENQLFWLGYVLWVLGKVCFCLSEKSVSEREARTHNLWYQL
jgi:hypothetical protein